MKQYRLQLETTSQWLYSGPCQKSLGSAEESDVDVIRVLYCLLYQHPGNRAAERESQIVCD